MTYTGRIIRVSDFLDLSECEEPGIVKRGPLLYKEPGEVYWRGLRLGATHTQAKLLGMLIRFGGVPAQLLMLLLPERDSGANAVKVHICRLRELLRFATDGRAQIETVRGEGYRLVVEE